MREIPGDVTGQSFLSERANVIQPDVIRQLLDREETRRKGRLLMNGSRSFWLICKGKTSNLPDGTNERHSFIVSTLQKRMSAAERPRSFSIRAQEASGSWNRTRRRAGTVIS